MIGMVRGNKLNYVRNDHLGRPEVLTNTSKAVVWKAQNSSYDMNEEKARHCLVQAQDESYA